MDFPSPLIQPNQVRLNDPDWVVFDCSFDLKDSEAGHSAFRAEHIPGAIYAHLDHDLAGHVIPGKTGRHPLPDVTDFTARLGAWGVTPDSVVVVYDTQGGAMAARLWWMLRALGHAQVALLDGGLAAWKRAGLPIVSGDGAARPPAHYAVERADWLGVADAALVERARKDAQYVVIDARAPERYRGEVEPIDTRAGHIPGAVNRFHALNLAPDGTFLPAKALRAQFESLLGDVAPQNALVYCGSGVTSCHHLVAMEAAGLHGALLYPGSWSEWITINS